MDALEQPFVLCVRVGTRVEKRDHAWSIASVYTGLCPCFLFLFFVSVWSTVFYVCAHTKVVHLSRTQDILNVHCT